MNSQVSYDPNVNFAGNAAEAAARRIQRQRRKQFADDQSEAETSSTLGDILGLAGTIVGMTPFGAPLGGPAVLGSVGKIGGGLLGKAIG